MLADESIKCGALDSKESIVGPVGIKKEKFPTVADEVVLVLAVLLFEPNVGDFERR